MITILDTLTFSEFIHVSLGQGALAVDKARVVVPKLQIIAHDKEVVGYGS